MKKNQAGFTLIELMIVVAVIGILAIVGLRSATGYAVRAKMSEAVLALSQCRTLISEVYLSADTIPTAGTWGCESTDHSKYIGTITTTDDGVVVAGLRGFGDLRIDTKDITLAPLNSAGTLMNTQGRVARWRCGATADGTDSTIPLEVLPSTCRGI
jgi:type IV pilus assembly protein PilA